MFGHLPSKGHGPPFLLGKLIPDFPVDRQGPAGPRIDPSERASLRVEVEAEHIAREHQLAALGALLDHGLEDAVGQPEPAELRLEPAALLKLAKGIETRLGRSGKSDAPRPIDIDILLYGEEVINTPELVIPHPRMAERAFVLIPLVEMAPDLVHTLLKKTIRELLKNITEKQGVLKLE